MSLVMILGGIWIICNLPVICGKLHNYWQLYQLIFYFTQPTTKILYTTTKWTSNQQRHSISITCLQVSRTEQSSVLIHPSFSYGKHGRRQRRRFSCSCKSIAIVFPALNDNIVQLNSTNHLQERKTTIIKMSKLTAMDCTE